MVYRNRIVEELNDFYGREGIVPSNFKCKNAAKCEVEAGREICGRGAQAHVGSKYGEGIGVVVLSLDTGGGGYDNIQERTETIESKIYSGANSHMKGTLELLRILIPQKADTELLKLFAMTNSAKCSGKTQERMRLKIQKNCSLIHIEEINILQPQLIVAQGPFSYQNFNMHKLTDEDLALFLESQKEEDDNKEKNLIQTLKRYVAKFELANGNSVVLIEGPHPSARQGLWQSFRDKSLPLINLYIQYIRNIEYYSPVLL
jgi:hypothetical protein